MSPPDLLLLVLVIVGFLAFNFFVQRRARSEQRRRAIELAMRQAQVAPPEENEPLEVVEERKQEEAAPATVLVAPRRISPSRLFRSESDLRHAVVVLTVLGPCRAQEPYE